MNQPSTYLASFLGDTVRVTSGPETGRYGIAVRIEPAQTTGLRNPEYLALRYWDGNSDSWGELAIYDPSTATFYAQHLERLATQAERERALRAFDGRRSRVLKASQWDRQGIARYNPADEYGPACVVVTNETEGWRYWLAAGSCLPELLELIPDQT
jgi:hypothetical protein